MIYVNSNSDALSVSPGICTLRGAIGAINSAGDANNCSNSSSDAYGTNDTIIFDNNLAGQTVQFASTILITKPLSIQGPGLAQNDASQRVTLKGGGASSNFRLLNVTVNYTALSVQDLKFSDARLTTDIESGAAIYNLGSGGSVDATRCDFSGNSAAGSNAYGGAISANAATISASTFSGNSATGANGYGGAIQAGVLVTVSASTFSGNSAMWGGAINGGTVEISASTFSGNSATGNGGAIDANAADISASTFSGNSATGISGEGGAIYVLFSLTARHLTLLDNTAPNGAAIYFSGVNNADLANSLIIGNNGNDHCMAGAGGGGCTFNGGYNLGWRPGANDVSCGMANAIAGSAVPRNGIISPLLADYGGPTLTLALITGGPAIGQADPIDPALSGTSQMLNTGFAWVDATLDQRGIARKALSAGRDLGASEAKITLSQPNVPIPALDARALLLLMLLTGGVAFAMRRQSFR